jgi:hypothetical protein
MLQDEVETELLKQVVRETQGWVAVVLGWVWVNCQKSEMW